jgi:hypothetical protein
VTVYTVVTYKTELAGKKRKEPGAAGRGDAGNIDNVIYNASWRFPCAGWRVKTCDCRRRLCFFFATGYFSSSISEENVFTRFLAENVFSRFLA